MKKESKESIPKDLSDIIMSFIKSFHSVKKIKDHTSGHFKKGVQITTDRNLTTSKYNQKTVNDIIANQLMKIFNISHSDAQGFFSETINHPHGHQKKPIRPPHPKKKSS